MNAQDLTAVNLADVPADDLFVDDLPATPITRPAASLQDRADDDEYLFHLTSLTFPVN